MAVGQSGQGIMGCLVAELFGHLAHAFLVAFALADIALHQEITIIVAVAYAGNLHVNRIGRAGDFGSQAFISYRAAAFQCLHGGGFNPPLTGVIKHRVILPDQ